METYIEEGKHLTLAKLKERTNNQYLEKISPENTFEIAAYPRPELHVTHVSHSTDGKGLYGIRAKRGFRNRNSDEYKVVWFSLTVTPEDLSRAETRKMKIVHPGGLEEEFTPRGAYGGRGGGVLKNFASSAAFLPSSRYGSYRFTFDLMDILEEYRYQFCNGHNPVMRTWKTKLYRQEVMYAVLVHSPDDPRFAKFPRLNETRHSICAFRQKPEPYFLWRPQAMCATHRFELVKSRGSLSTRPQHKQYFVWDNVALALVVDDKVLRFSGRMLRRSLWFCEKEEGVHPKVIFDPYYIANRVVCRLWPYSGSLWRFDSLEQQWDFLYYINGHR